MATRNLQRILKIMDYSKRTPGEHNTVLKIIYDITAFRSFTNNYIIPFKQELRDNILSSDKSGRIDLITEYLRAMKEYSWLFGVNIDRQKKANHKEDYYPFKNYCIFSKGDARPVIRYRYLQLPNFRIDINEVQIELHLLSEIYIFHINRLLSQMFEEIVDVCLNHDIDFDMLSHRIGIYPGLLVNAKQKIKMHRSTLHGSRIKSNINYSQKTLKDIWLGTEQEYKNLFAFLREEHKIEDGSKEGYVTLLKDKPTIPNLWSGSLNYLQALLWRLNECKKIESPDKLSAKNYSQVLLNTFNFNSRVKTLSPDYFKGLDNPIKKPDQKYLQPYIHLLDALNNPDMVL